MKNEYQKIAVAIQQACSEELNRASGITGDSQLLVSHMHRICLTATNSMQLVENAMLQIKRNGQSIEDLPLRPLLMQLTMFNNSVNSGRSAESTMLAKAAVLLDESLTMQELECFYKANNAVNELKDKFNGTHPFVNELSERLAGIKHGNMREEFAMWELENSIYGYNATYSDDYDVRVSEGAEAMSNNEILKQIKPHMTSPICDALESLKGTFSREDGTIYYSALEGENASFIKKNAPKLTELQSYFLAVRNALSDAAKQLAGNAKVNPYNMIKGIIGESIDNKDDRYRAGQACEKYFSYLNYAVCGSGANEQATQAHLDADFMKEARAELLEKLPEPSKVESVLDTLNQTIIDSVRNIDLKPKQANENTL